MPIDFSNLLSGRKREEAIWEAINSNPSLLYTLPESTNLYKPIDITSRASQNSTAFSDWLESQYKRVPLGNFDLANFKAPASSSSTTSSLPAGLLAQKNDIMGRLNNFELSENEPEVPNNLGHTGGSNGLSTADTKKLPWDTITGVLNDTAALANTVVDSAQPDDISFFDDNIDRLNNYGRGLNYSNNQSVLSAYNNMPSTMALDVKQVNPTGLESAKNIGMGALQGAKLGNELGGVWGAVGGLVVGGGLAAGADSLRRRANGINVDLANTRQDIAEESMNMRLLNGADQAHNVAYNTMYKSRMANGGQIHIKKENEGKFTAAAKRHNMSVQEFAKHVLAKKNKGKYSATMRRRANFARNASKWHAEGGFLYDYPEGLE